MNFYFITISDHARMNGAEGLPCSVCIYHAMNIH